MKYAPCRYKQGATLAGILYFHRISDFRTGGISKRNFNMFRKLCGDKTLQNVVIITNMWGEVDPRIGNAREAVLMRNDFYFKPVIDKGAKIVRHDNTTPSAKRIIRLILPLLENYPLPLRMKEGPVDESGGIIRTGADESGVNQLLNLEPDEAQKYANILDAVRHFITRVTSFI
jgi:hypothetical protein